MFRAFVGPFRRSMTNKFPKLKQSQEIRQSGPMTEELCLCSPVTILTRRSTHTGEASRGTMEINGKEIVEVTQRNAGAVLDRYDSILLDCDGVLWAADHVHHIPGIPQAMDTLRQLGKQVLFVTNNSMHGRSAYVKKFRQHGFDAPAEDVFCVAYASAIYLKSVAKITGSVYVIGEQGMVEDLESVGLESFGVGPDPDPVYENIMDLKDVPLRDDVSAVLVGYDKHFDMRKLFKACSYLSSPGCVYVATNDKEKVITLAPGLRQPLTGAIVDAVTSASGQRPHVVGKPHTALFECITTAHPGIDPRRCLMVGDSVTTDIGFAKAVGMDSALVLTGASDLDTVRSKPGLEPTYFMSSLAVLAK